MAECFGSVVNLTMKWQIALVVGLPVAVGVGYWYLLRKNKNSRDFGDDEMEFGRAGLSHDSDTSIEALRKHEKLPLEQATILKEKGNQYFKKGEYEEAIKFYEKAIELCPDTEVLNLATFYQNKAAAFEHLNNYEEVIKACTEALVLNPKYTKALIRRAKAYEKTKELSLAFEDLTTVCILENFQSQATLISADVLLNELVQQNATKAMENCVPSLPSNYTIGSYLGTFVNDPIHQFFSKTDGDFTKGFLKAIKCLKEEDYESVIAACTVEILDPEAIYENEATLLRGTFHLLSGNLSAALSDFDAVANNDKLDKKLRVNALIKKATLHTEVGNSSKCFEEFEKAVELDSNNSDIYHHRGQIDILCDKLQEAAEDFAMANKLNPNYSVTAAQKCYTDYRYALLSKDDAKIKSVMNKLEELITENPQCSECHSIYAQVLTSQEEYDKADVLYEKAFKLDQKNANILVYRGVSKLKKFTETDAAIKLIEQALEIDNKCAVAYETLGTINVQIGNIGKGIEMFDKAIKLAKNKMEMTHFYTLKNAAEAQKKVLEKLNIQIPVNAVAS